MPEPPTDYPQNPPAPCKPSALKTLWVPILLTLLVPTLYAIFLGGIVSNRIDVLAQDVAENGIALSTTPSTFVPRAELDAKLDNIQLQVGHVQANVEELKEQSERQTAEIIRRIERIVRSP